MEREWDAAPGTTAGLDLDRFDAVGPFLRRAGQFLEEREAEHNLILGICSALQRGAYTEPPYLAAVVEDERVVATAIRTPPWQLVISEVDNPRAIDLLVADLVHEPLPGWLGPVEAAQAFAERWQAETGQRPLVGLSERIFRLTTVRPPTDVSGAMIRATVADRDLLIAWTNDFVDEALRGERPEPIEQVVDRGLAAGRITYVWVDDGRPVSLAGAGGATPHGIRIGPVYTPPELRRRGYASALVAAASQEQLDAGKRFAFLFTDLANPTSNHIYQEIGYEPVRDVRQYRLAAG
jgi:predicted GNAT family acetyltransferase